MKCDRCGNDSFDVEFVQYSERDGSLIMKSGWLCQGCRCGVAK